MSYSSFDLFHKGLSLADTFPFTSPIHILHAHENSDIQRNIKLVKHCSTVFKLVV